MWEKIKQDIIERLLTVETAKGLYLLPAGLYGLYMVQYHQQFTYQLLLNVLFGYMVFEGVRKITVNRIKQMHNQEKLIEKRIGATEP